jgi:glycosyltransferase involved in cell wall biosynthesis
MGAGSGAAPALTFVIPVRNDAVGLARCLESIARSAVGVETETIVIDNGSVDGSGQTAARAGARVLVVPDQPVATLRNRGAAAAGSPLLAFVDADHEIDPQWVATAIATMSDPAIVAAGAPYSPPSHASWVQQTYNGLRDHRPGQRQVLWLGSGNMVVRREAFLRVNGFDDALEACEDVDLSRRLRGTGGLLVSDSRLRSTHYGDPASLAALFRAELWRGRNNLRVSLREPLTVRTMPSIAAPVVTLVFLVAALVLLAGAQWQLATGSALVATAPAFAHAVRLARRAAVPWHHALAVAFTYDVARALALVMRQPHRRVRPDAIIAAR